ncbi:AzlC family ABC transporter permease [Denitromonas sp.]|uniref:AzlC family ABC transporter permease n=1 Tax=Denitromonas sp. TaxID=2734609 RepID=UPI002B00014D|nr:AzlC family ABC transporter permease [Denitromonas sp.]
MTTVRHALFAGARDALPLMIGTLPFGVIYGTTAVAAGLSPLAALAMSVIVFAGSAQFIAVSLISGGAALPVIWLTTFVVNLRHALYSATVHPAAQGWGLRWRALVAFWLTDEVFAVIEKRLMERGNEALLPYALGAGGGFYLNWLTWTAAGAWLGQQFPDLAGWGLDFAMIATFAAMVAPQLRASTPVVVALAAGTTAWLARGLPFKLGLILAAFAGVAAGVWMDHQRKARTARA